MSLRFFRLLIVCNLIISSTSPPSFECVPPSINYGADNCIVGQELKLLEDISNASSSYNWTWNKCASKTLGSEQGFRWRLPKMDSDDKRKQLVALISKISQNATRMGPIYVWLGIRRDASQNAIEEWGRLESWRWHDGTTLAVMDSKFQESLWSSGQLDNAAFKINSAYEERCALAKIESTTAGGHDYVCEMPSNDPQMFPLRVNISWLVCESSASIVSSDDDDEITWPYYLSGSLFIVASLCFSAYLYIVWMKPKLRLRRRRGVYRRKRPGDLYDNDPQSASYHRVTRKNESSHYDVFSDRRGSDKKELTGTKRLQEIMAKFSTGIPSKKMSTKISPKATTVSSKKSITPIKSVSPKSSLKSSASTTKEATKKLSTPMPPTKVKWNFPFKLEGSNVSGSGYSNENEYSKVTSAK